MSLFRSLLKTAASSISYGYSWVSPTAWANWWKDCPPGDFACELTNHKVYLPEPISNVIAKFEDVTGVSKYIAGPIITGGAALLVGRYLMNKYKAKDPYDLIHKIIDTEFGKGSVADHLFQAFETSIERGIDQVIGRAKEADTKMSVTEQAAKRKEIKAEIVKSLAPHVKEALTKHNKSIATIVSNLPKATQVGQLPALGEQQAKASNTLTGMINGLVAQAVGEQQAKYLKPGHRLVDYRVAHKLPSSAITPCVMVEVDADGKIVPPTTFKLGK
jgi:hypothetical protein